jgi:hypothetical protein
MPMGTRSGFIRATRLIALACILLALYGAGLRDTVAQTEQEREDGLVGERRYESPQYGYAVEWQDSWDVFSVMSVPDGNFDTLALTDGASVISFVSTGDRASAAAQIELTVDNLEQSEPDLEVIALDLEGEVPSATFEFTAPGPADGVDTLVRLYVEASPLPFPQTVLSVMLRAAVEDFDAEMAAAQATITLDGAPPFSGQAAPEDEGPSPTPETGEPASEGGALDLAAMTLRPADLDGDYGLSGSFVLTLEEQAAIINDQRGGNDEDLDALIATLTDTGFRRNYVNTLGIPQDEDPDLFARSVSSYVTEYADADGAAAGFAELEDETNIADSEDIPGTRTIGDQSEITLVQATTTDAGDPYRSLDLTFQIGNLIGGVTIADFTGGEPEVEEVEALADTLLERIEEVRDAEEGDGLSGQVLRFAGDGVDTFYDRYQRLDGETFRFFNETDADLASRGQSHSESGFTDTYNVGQAIGTGAAASDDYVFFAVILHRFASEAEASAWIQETPAAFAASPGSFEDVAVISDLDPIGDESAAVEYRFGRTADVETAGYAIYVRVGAVVATVQVDAPSDLSRATVESLAAAQADCLSAGACLDPAPVPDEWLGTPSDGTPEPDESAPMNQADKLRDLLDDLD